MDTFTRRIELWRLLSSAPRPVGLRELALRFGCSKHTIQRDLDALSRARVVVEELRRGQSSRFLIRPSGRPPS